MADARNTCKWPALARGSIAAAIAITALSVVGLLARDRLPFAWSARTWALTASTGFVFVAACAWWLCRTTTASAVLWGLVFCWLGDYLGLTQFEFGALSFLLAHLFFVAGFLWPGVVLRRLVILGPLVIASTLLTALWLLPHVAHRELPLVVGYMVVISVMVIASGATAGTRWPFTLTAAAIFYISDMAVARWRFVDSDPINGFVCYPLYYTACLMLALSPMVIWNADRRTRNGG